MSWSNLSLSPGFTNVAGFPPARVRVLTGIPNAAQLEGYLAYSGANSPDMPITTEASMPAGSYDTGSYHTVSGRCYDGGNSFLGACDVLVQENGTLGIFGPMPAGTARLYFGGIYPVS